MDQGLYTGLEEKSGQTKRESKVRGIGHTDLGRMLKKGFHSFLFCKKNKKILNLTINIDEIWMGRA